MTEPKIEDLIGKTIGGVESNPEGVLLIKFTDRTILAINGGVALGIPAEEANGAEGTGLIV